ncbi:hypothetical protein JTE90_025428 [Oedothorax gibbosus]|uniref:Uncharacterized protein n=1 Tax=Oedothorax gibbosus TaxID=931172 RepID=A0AAV6U990_9ARAC|nr:hypothetical protein JTE90_025428 [Oedothorax gibbosus]
MEEFSAARRHCATCIEWVVRNVMLTSANETDSEPLGRLNKKNGLEYSPLKSTSRCLGFGRLLLGSYLRRLEGLRWKLLRLHHRPVLQRPHRKSLQHRPCSPRSLCCCTIRRCPIRRCPIRIRRTILHCPSRCCCFSLLCRSLCPIRIRWCSLRFSSVEEIDCHPQLLMPRTTEMTTNGT